jgi:hypothetical protein
MAVAHDKPATDAPITPDGWRTPACADAAATPQAGERCVCCWGRWWWSEANASRGWRCWCCIPAPTGLPVVETQT